MQNLDNQNSESRQAQSDILPFRSLARSPGSEEASLQFWLQKTNELLRAYAAEVGSPGSFDVTILTTVIKLKRFLLRCLDKLSALEEKRNHSLEGGRR